MPKPSHLEPSSLGEKSYWDTIYTRELTNFTTSPSDEGTIWFSDASAEERMIAHLERLSDSSLVSKLSARILDLGTGNGHMLMEMREEGWEGEMLGVDYSLGSVELAGRIWEERRRKMGEGEMKGVRFEVWDILTEEAGGWVHGGFDVVLDKGTFDAISLSGEEDAEGRRVSERYRERVEPLVKDGGRFLITSCNWTSEELRAWFEVEGGEFVYEDSVKYPSFTFGGKTGQKVCTLCFKKKVKA